MEKRKRLVKPQSTETVENISVYACEVNPYCPNTNPSGCGGGCTCLNISNCGRKCKS